MNKEKISGVYGIKAINPDSEYFDQWYIGRTVDFHSRISEHKRVLRLGQHHSIKLQRYFDKYGFDGLLFLPTLLIECESNQLNFHEINLIKEYNSYKSGFNCTTGGEGINGQFGRKCTLKNVNTGEIVSYNSIQEFCKSHNVNNSSISGLLNGKYDYIENWCNVDFGLESHWKYLKDPNGKTHRIFNLRKFCEENQLSYKRIWCVISETAHGYKGWTNPNHDKNKNKELFKFINSENEIFSTFSLKELAKKQNLNAYYLTLLHTERIKIHKGWRKYKAEYTISLDGKNCKILKSYKFIDSNNTIHNSTNLSDLARKSGIKRDNLYAVWSGRILQHKGWKLFKE